MAKNNKSDNKGQNSPKNPKRGPISPPITRKEKIVENRPVTKNPPITLDGTEKRKK